MSILKWLKSWMTMRRGEHLFTDCVSGDGVYTYVDCYGKQWMAHYNRFGFRVPRYNARAEGEKE